jgi:hypothetical protein
MTQKEIKALASEIIGDGQLPNKFFVTVSPYITTIDEFGDHNSELIDGYTDEDSTIEVFDTYEEAEEYFNTIDLDHRYGTGQAMIEDRLTGQIAEIFLESVVEVNYHLRGHDMSKTFGYKK